MHFLACAFLLCAHPSAYTASRVALYSGTAFDLTTTVAINAHEANGIVGNGPPASQVAIASGLTVFSDILLKKTGHTKAGTILNFVAGSVHIGAGVWNIRNGPQH